MNIVVPQIEHTASEKSAAIVPNDLPSTAELVRMSSDFGQAPSTAVGSVVITSERKIDSETEKYYSELVSRLVSDREHVSYVLDMFGERATREFAVSPDGKAMTLLVAERGDIGTADAHRATAAIRAHLSDAPRPDGVQAYFSGPAPTVVDEFTSMETSMVIITAVSVLLITIMMIATYRSIVAALVPLITIGVALGASRATVSVLGWNGLLPVSTLTVTLMTVLVLAAGTDYAIFQMAAYHDGRRQLLAAPRAVAFAGMSVGEVLTASAFTIAASATAMIFAKNGMFTTSGPAIAIGILVTLAVSLTFTPALMTLLGRRGWIEPRPPKEAIWRRRGRAVLRRPIALTAASLLLLTVLALPVLTYRANADDNAMQIYPTDSSRGYDAVMKHFGANEILPEYLVIRSDHDMRNTQDLAALERAAGAVADLPTVAYVKSLTRPAGKQLQESTIGYQAAAIGQPLADASKEIQNATPDLIRLAQGVTALRDGAQNSQARLPELVSGVNQVVNLSTSVLDLLPAATTIMSVRTPDGRSLTDVLAQLDPILSTVTPLVTALEEQRRAINMIEASLSPYTSQTPPNPCDATCTTGRQLLAQLDQLSGGTVLAALRSIRAVSDLSPGTFQTLTETLPRLRAGLTALNQLTASLQGRTPDSVRSDLKRLQSGMKTLTTGIDALTAGLGQVKTGTDATVAMTDRLRGGLDQAAQYLLTMATQTSSGPGAGFYLPPQALTDPRLIAGAKLLMSADGRTARMLVISSVNPYSGQALDKVSDIATTAQQSLKGSTLAHANASSTGLSSTSADIVHQSGIDFLIVAVVAMTAVLLILILLLRSLLAPLLLVSTVVLSFLSAAGVSIAFWQHIVGVPLHWSVLPVSFMCLVAVGADYSMLFASRVRDLSSAGTTSAILRTFGSTGRVITTAGVVFAVTMFALLSGSVILILQSGFTVGLGLLLDIAVVRTILIPCALHLLGRHAWWPATRLA